MSKGLVFWIIMLLLLIHWGGTNWGGWSGGPFLYAGSILIFVLLFLLGWHDFGFIIY